jgi:hypothetical protein
MQDHQGGQLHPIDQDQACRHPFRVISGIGGESARPDEDTSVCLCSVEGAQRRILSLATDGVVWAVTLCLYVDSIKAEGFLANHSIEPLVTAAAEVFRYSCLSSVTHGRQELQDQLL